MNEETLDKLRAMLFLAEEAWPALLEEVVQDLGGGQDARRWLHDFLDQRIEVADDSYVMRMTAMRDRLGMGLQAHHQSDPVDEAFGNLLKMEKLVDATRAALADQMKELRAYRDTVLGLLPPEASHRVGHFVVTRPAPEQVLRVVDPSEVPLSLCKTVPDPQALRMYLETHGQAPPGTELVDAESDLEVVEDPRGMDDPSENHW